MPYAIVFDTQNNCQKIIDCTDFKAGLYCYIDGLETITKLTDAEEVFKAFKFKDAAEYDNNPIQVAIEDSTSEVTEPEIYYHITTEGKPNSLDITINATKKSQQHASNTITDLKTIYDYMRSLIESHELEILSLNNLTITDTLLQNFIGPTARLECTLNINDCRITDISNPPYIASLNLNEIDFDDLSSIRNLCKNAVNIEFYNCEIDYPLLRDLLNNPIPHTPARNITLFIPSEIIQEDNDELHSLITEYHQQLPTIKIICDDTDEDLTEYLRLQPTIFKRIDAMSLLTNEAELILILDDTLSLDISHPLDGPSLQRSKEAFNKYISIAFDRLEKPLSLATLREFIKESQRLDQQIIKSLSQHVTKFVGEELAELSHLSYHAALLQLIQASPAVFDASLIYPTPQPLIAFINSLPTVHLDHGQCHSILTQLMQRITKLQPYQSKHENQQLLLNWQSHLTQSKQALSRRFNLHLKVIENHLAMDVILETNLLETIEDIVAFACIYGDTHLTSMVDLLLSLTNLAQTHITLCYQKFYDGLSNFNQTKLDKNIERTTNSHTFFFQRHANRTLTQRSVIWPQWVDIYATWAEIRNLRYHLKHHKNDTEPAAKRSRLCPSSPSLSTNPETVFGTHYPPEQSGGWLHTLDTQAQQLDISALEQDAAFSTDPTVYGLDPSTDMSMLFNL